MRLLSLSLDPLLLEEGSVVAIRNRAYGSMLDSYSIIVPSASVGNKTLDNNTTVYSSGYTHKLMQLWSIYTIANDLCKKESINVITSQDMYFLGLLGWILARRYHCGLEVQVLGIEKLNFFRKLLARFVLAHASAIRVLSLGLRKRLLTEFAIDDVRMQLVPIYVDVSTLGLHGDADERTKKEIEIQSDLFRTAYSNRFNIVSVNRLVPIKNISMQLQMIQNLVQEFPNTLLHIVGEGQLKEELIKEIAVRGIEKNVLLQGFKTGPQLSPFFTASDCFVLTSNFEGYGMVVIEAATAGLPIVMTDVGCAGEIIINEQSGLVVAPQDVQAFTHAVKRIMIDSRLREKLSSEAKKVIDSLPSFEQVQKKYKASWQFALDNKL